MKVYVVLQEYETFQEGDRTYGGGAAIRGVYTDRERAEARAREVDGDVIELTVDEDAE